VVDSQLVGDVDCDEDVDILDVLVLLQTFALSGTGPPGCGV
jgi:hypothetical protein